MGEYLDLLLPGTDDDIRELLTTALPGLHERLDIHDGRVSTKLATCNDIFFTLDEMATLYRFIRNRNAIAYGPRTQHNNTPEVILTDRSSLYLGSWEERQQEKQPRVAVPAALADGIEHRTRWQPTETTPTEEEALPRGVFVPCPHAGQPFTASEVGHAWDWQRNRGRTIYQCPGCETLFNMGEYDTPQYADVAALLRHPGGNGHDD